MTPVDLAAILAHPRNGGAHVIDPPEVEAASSDDIGSSRIRPHSLREVRLATDLGGLGDHGEHALAILTAPPPEEPWAQDALIRRVRDRGYRMLAVPDAERFGSGSRYLARRIGLMILAIDDPMGLARATWELLEGQEAMTLAYVRRVAGSIRYPAENLADLLRHLSAGLGHGVAVIDADGIVLQAGGQLPESVRVRIDPVPWSHTVSLPEGCAASIRLENPYLSGLRLVIFEAGLSRAQLNILLVVAEIAMPSVAARILIGEVADISDAAADSALLREFLDQRAILDGDLDKRMTDRGWRLTGYHLGFRVAGRTRLDPLHLLRAVRRSVVGLPLGAHAATSGRGVTGWLSFSELPPAMVVESLVDALHRTHLDLRRSLNIATGIGALDSGATGLLATIDGACNAARVAANRRASGHFMRVDALGLEQLLLSWTETDRFVPAATALLAPLTVETPELLSTLAAYLDHESGVANTADALGLHRNTVSSRISRARRLLGLDLTDPETRLAVHLACRALRRSGS